MYCQVPNPSFINVVPHKTEFAIQINTPIALVGYLVGSAFIDFAKQSFIRDLSLSRKLQPLNKHVVSETALNCVPRPYFLLLYLQSSVFKERIVPSFSYLGQNLRFRIWHIQISCNASPGCRAALLETVKYAEGKRRGVRKVVKYPYCPSCQSCQLFSK